MATRGRSKRQKTVGLIKNEEEEKKKNNTRNIEILPLAGEENCGTDDHQAEKIDMGNSVFHQPLTRTVLEFDSKSLDFLSKMSLEILCKVMGYLPLRDIMKLEYLCKKIQEAVNMHLRLVTTLDFIEDRIYGWMSAKFNDTTLANFLVRCPDLTKIFGLFPPNIAKRRQRGQDTLSIPGVVTALQYCPKLRGVEICDIFLLEAILMDLPRIDILRTFRNRNGLFPILQSNKFQLTRNSKITSLYLSGVVITELPRMDHLKELHMKWVKLTYPLPFRDFGVPLLRTFVMENCAGPANALKYVPLVTGLAAARSLTRLELVRVPFLGGLIQHVVEDSWRMQGFRQLQKVVIGTCKHALEVDLGYLIITCGENLEELSVQPSLTKDSFFSSLTLADVSFPVFESLHLGYVHDFPEPGKWTNEQLVKHGLADISENPAMITDIGLKAVGRAFPMMKYLTIYNCPHLHHPTTWFSSDIQTFQRIKELHLWRCHAIKLEHFCRMITMLPNIESLYLEQMFREPPKGCSRVGLSAGTGLGVSSALVSNTGNDPANQDGGGGVAAGGAAAGGHIHGHAQNNAGGNQPAHNNNNNQQHNNNNLPQNNGGPANQANPGPNGNQQPANQGQNNAAGPNIPGHNHVAVGPDGGNVAPVQSDEEEGEDADAEENEEDKDKESKDKSVEEATCGDAEKEDSGIEDEELSASPKPGTSKSDLQYKAEFPGKVEKCKETQSKDEGLGKAEEREETDMDVTEKDKVDVMEQENTTVKKGEEKGASHINDTMSKQSEEDADEKTCDEKPLDKDNESMEVATCEKFDHPENDKGSKMKEKKTCVKETEEMECDTEKNGAEDKSEALVDTKKTNDASPMKQNEESKANSAKEEGLNKKSEDSSLDKKDSEKSHSDPPQSSTSSDQNKDDAEKTYKGKGKSLMGNKKGIVKRSRNNSGQVNQSCQAVSEEIRETTKKAKENEDAAKSKTTEESSNGSSSSDTNKKDETKAEETCEKSEKEKDTSGTEKPDTKEVNSSPEPGNSNKNEAASQEPKEEKSAEAIKTNSSPSNSNAASKSDSSSKENAALSPSSPATSAKQQKAAKMRTGQSSHMTMKKMGKKRVVTCDKATSTSDPVIEEDHIQILVIRSESLVNLTLRQVGITDLVLEESPKLQMLSGSACRVLKHVLIKQSPRLTRVSFAQCKKLNHTDLVDEICMQPGDRNRQIFLRPMQDYYFSDMERQLFRSAMYDYHMCLIHDWTLDPEATLYNRLRVSSWLDLMTSINSDLIQKADFQSAKRQTDLKDAINKYPWGRSIYRMQGKSREKYPWELITDFPWLRTLSTSKSLNVNHQKGDKKEEKGDGLYCPRAKGHTCANTEACLELIQQDVAEAKETGMKLHTNSVVVYVNLCDRYSGDPVPDRYV